MAWQPQQEPVRELAGYLKDALSARDQNAQKFATMVCQMTGVMFNHFITPAFVSCAGNDVNFT